MDDIDFDAPDLADRIEQLSQYDLDHLPFGVILLDREGTVLFYSETEAQLSGYAPRSPLGQNLFEVSRCMNSDAFRGRIARAAEAGKVDLDIGWHGDFGDPNRDLRIRVQSARSGGVWIFIARDGAPASPGPGGQSQQHLNP